MQKLYTKTNYAGLYYSQNPDEVRFEGIISTRPPGGEIRREGMPVNMYKQGGLRLEGILVKPDEVERDLLIHWQSPKGEGFRIEIKKMMLSEGIVMMNEQTSDIRMSSPEDEVGGKADKGGTSRGEQRENEKDKRDIGKSDDGKSNQDSGRRVGEVNVEEAKNKAREKTKEEKQPEEIFLYVRERQRSEGRLIFNKRTQDITFTKVDKEGSQKTAVITFSKDSQVQIFPFRKGRVFCFIDCGQRTKLNHDQTEREDIKEKQLCALLGPDKDPYVDREAQAYLKYKKEYADHNAEVMDEFIEELKRFVHVRECTQREETDVERRKRELRESMKTDE